MSTTGMGDWGEIVVSEKTARPVLTPRERECLEQIARGKRVQAISEMLCIAPVTVELHLKNARKKLGAATAPEAVALAMRIKAISPYA